MTEKRINGDVQETLDSWLASNPDAAKYVTKLYYLPDGADIPADVTHVNRLSAKHDQSLDLRIGVVTTPATAAMADFILGMLDRADDAGNPKREH